MDPKSPNGLQILSSNPHMRDGHCCPPGSETRIFQFCFSEYRMCIKNIVLNYASTTCKMVNDLNVFHIA